MPQPLTTSGSYCVAPAVVDEPKFWLAIAPHSPLAPGSVRLQSGTKSRLPSVHARVVMLTRRLIGLWGRPNSPVLPWPATYLLRLTFIAVLPLPNTSTARPIFGVRSCHDTPGVAGSVMSRFGRSAVGPTCCSGNDVL